MSDWRFVLNTDKRDEFKQMPNLLIIDPDRATVNTFRRTFADDGVAVHAARSEEDALEMCREIQPDVVFLALQNTSSDSDRSSSDGSDMRLFQQLQQRESGTPIILLSTGGSSSRAIKFIERGAFDYVVKPVAQLKIQELVGQALRNRQKVDGAPTTGNGEGIVGEPTACDLLVGHSPSMQVVYKAIGQVALKNVNVLILGESGTGKELVAQAIQQHSARVEAPFLTVNCAAIPETLLESELFGHEKGAFTGADGKRIGKFEQCNGGTLFLDEVGDMTPLMQSKLLRVLQEGCFERVGGNNLVRTDVRIIAATNRHLAQMVMEGQFRADLYYRLNVFTIALPALRERRSDLPLLVAHFLEVHSHALGKPPCQVTPETMELLQQYPWPGNIRELQSALIYAMLHTHGPRLFPENFPNSIANFNQSDNAIDLPERPTKLDAFIDERLQAGSTSLYAEATAFLEQILITKVLRHTEGNQSQAAVILNITRGTLRTKIRMLGISIQQSIDIGTENFETLSSHNGDLVSVL